MDIVELLGTNGVVANLRATSKKQALQELSKRAAEVTGQPERAIFEVLVERERLGTTGVGQGIAIPHGKMPGLDRIYGIFARAETPIEFDSIDEQPVDLIFLLLAPESAGADHLKALARVSRLLLIGNDGSERFYRQVERLVCTHPTRLLPVWLDAASDELAGVLSRPGGVVRGLSIEHKDSVTRLLFALYPNRSEPASRVPAP